MPQVRSRHHVQVVLIASLIKYDHYQYDDLTGLAWSHLASGRGDSRNREDDETKPKELRGNHWKDPRPPLQIKETEA